jgi:AraC-like DNA-binding protein
VATPKTGWRCGGSVPHTTTETMNIAAGIPRTPCATQQLILETATAVGFNAGHWVSRTPTPAPTPLNVIFPASFIPLYRQCMTALYRASTPTPIVDHPNGLPTVDEVELFCACLIHCEDLEAVIAKAIRFTRFFNTRGESMALTVSATESSFHMHTQNKDRSTPALLCDLFGLGFFNKLFSWLIGEPLQLSRVDTVYSPLIEPAIADHMAGGPVQFGSAHNALSFPTDLLRRPVIRRHKELSELLQAAPFELIDILPRPALPQQIERLFRKMIAEGLALPSLDRVAEQVGQRASTLRRHLALQETSYQSLVDRCRLERAQELLRDTAMTVDDIAAHLGYSASSSFSRAFKDWVGMAPSLYRQRLVEPMTASGRVGEPPSA